MPRTINTGNAIGAALRWIFPADEATLPYPDDASGISVIAGANAAINNSQPLLGPLSARPSAGGQTTAGGFRSNSIPSGLTYPITLACKYVISQSPAGDEPVLGIFRWSSKTILLRFAQYPARFQAFVRNEGVIAEINGPALPDFNGVKNLAVIVTSPTQRSLYINGTVYTDSSGTTVDYTSGAIYQRIGVGAAFDDGGDVIVSGSGNMAWSAIFGAALTAGQLDTYFADPAGTVFVPAVDTTAPTITGPGGSANGPFSTTTAENSTVVGTYTANEAVTWTKSGTDNALFSLTPGAGNTVAVARLALVDFDAVGADARTFTLTATDSASPANVRNVTINNSITNVVEPPNVPTIGTATAGNQTITVPFTPGAAGAMPSVIDFSVTLSPSNISKTVSASPAVFNAGDGIVNGVAQTATVRARNSDGFSASSAASNSVTPSAPLGPTLSVPTKSTPTATSAVGGFTTNGTNGTAHMVWTTSATPPSSTQVKAGLNELNATAAASPPDLTITSAGPRSFASVTVTQGVTYYGYVVHTNAGGNDSDVFALGPVYPGTGRAVADVSTVGWTGSAAGPLCNLINEDVRNDANYISSPALSGVPSGATFELSQTYTPGNYSGANGFKISLWTDTGVGVARVKFLNSSSVVVGQTADQAVNTTPTLYTLPVTLTANATRWMLEVNA